ncbi:ABC-three component system middle component 5 [Tenacibaculum maritimum]|nr:ABC-three component system middle component 5 [Tenacibaculum maritimum]
MLHLLNKIDDEKGIEIDRLRIWDFYLLFNNEIRKIKPRRNEKDFKGLLKELNLREENPYQIIKDERKTLETIKPFQYSALNCLASYGIIDKKSLIEDQVYVKSRKLLIQYINSIGALSIREQNVISIVTSTFYDITLFGDKGLKNRTNLIESKYDSE